MLYKEVTMIHNPSRNGTRKKIVLTILTVLGTYVFLLIISYGFPVTGDDWFFTPSHLADVSWKTPFSHALKILVREYNTTSGRVLGHFFVSLTSISKITREVIRCGIILLIVLLTYRITDGNGLTEYLLGFALLISLPGKIAGQTYSWAAGFFNYVPPALVYLLYAGYIQRLFSEEGHKDSPLLCCELFLLGLCGQLFLENVTLAFFVISASVLLIEIIRTKRLRLSLLLHLIGTILGGVIMFLAPGYQNVGNEGYREIPHSIAGMISVLQNNFHTLSKYLVGSNYLVIILLCASGFMLCLRSRPSQSSAKKRILSVAMLCFCVCPVLAFGLNRLERYFFALDLLCDLLLLAAVFTTAVLCISERRSRFLCVFCIISFVLFMAPLMVVSPVGARNCYLFHVLLVLLMLSFFRWAFAGLDPVKKLRPVICFACCVVLLGNAVIYIRNGKTEALRKQLTAEAMDRGEQTIVLPNYPYPSYVHGGTFSSIEFYYYYEKPQDIHFTFVPYNEWIQNNNHES